MQNFTSRINPNIYISAAIQLGLEFKILDDKNGIVEISDGDKKLKVHLAVLSCFDESAKKLSKDKIKSLELLEKNNIPTTLGKLFSISKKTEILEFIHIQLAMSSVVLKMNNGKGGKHVYVGITDIQEAEIAIDNMASDGVEEIIVEKYFSGKNFRAIVVNGKLLDIVERTVPHVVGDGIHTLEQLIKIKNEFKHDHEDVYLISQDLVSASGFNANHVPSNLEIVKLSNISSLTMGGDVHRVDLNIVNPAIKESLCKIQSVSGLFYCGIDIISENLQNNFVVNEYNYAPGMTLHYLADYEKSLDVPKKILQEYFLNYKS